ncbi:hypothetical protein ACP70R_021257 [Stipagrostis hirtigluma subsp. patula]
MPSPAAPPASAAGKPSRSAIVGGTTVSGHHLLEIEGYSHTKEELPTGKCITSRPFSVAGSYWCIRYYPNGVDSGSADFISVFLHLVQGAAAAAAKSVKARAKFTLLDHAGRPVPSHTRTLREFAAEGKGYGYPDFVKRAWLEESTCLKDGCFTIRCDVTLVSSGIRTEERRAAADASSRWVVVPPSDLHRQLGDLLAAKESVDVTFLVGGETFMAHRCLLALAARSPVFKAELFSAAMKESTAAAVIRVDDMEPKVFGALLGFIYTDMVPSGGPGTVQKEEIAMAEHLLVAADRYDLKRLKLICEDKLCRLIDTGSAATILTLAEQNNCRGLKNACLHFLSSPSKLIAVAATDGFEHLARSCPSVMKELIDRRVARQTNYGFAAFVAATIC